MAAGHRIAWNEQDTTLTGTDEGASIYGYDPTTRALMDQGVAFAFMRAMVGLGLPELFVTFVVVFAVETRLTSYWFSGLIE